ncbi:putative capsular polysaccharide synthesis family protein [Celeribacter sp.]|uniref:putative capsular polysaccharide synthesis family protein n=1 Tax=Celeribacter sp. TaxID=1890673 RepID=UPI003A8D732A
MFTRKGVTLNYQMGKIGSSSIGEWFRQNNIGEWHIHRFFDTPVHSRRGKNRALKVLDFAIFKLLTTLRKDIKVVTGVRFPLERDISMYFHNAYGIEMRPLPNAGEVDEVIADFNASFPVCASASWFDDELKRLTGVDIFDHPFDREKGFAEITDGRFRVFVYRLDKLDTLQSELSRFLGEPEFQLIKMNDSTSKRYTVLYRAFKKAYVREPGMISAPEQKFLEHFYEPDMIDQHLRRTSARSEATR